MKKQATYGNESISSLKRCRSVFAEHPAVIFGSNGIEGCSSISTFEISRPILFDEAREGYRQPLLL